MLLALNCGAQPVTIISAGDVNSLFLKSDGSLWAMGNDDYGQLGNGTNYPDPYGLFTSGTNRPERIVASNVTAIAGGGGHALFLKSDGSLWAMGDNAAGQLGDGTTNLSNVPEQIVPSNVVAIAAGETHSLFIKNDGSLWGMGANGLGELGDDAPFTNYPNTGTNQPEQIVASNVVAIAAGGEFSLFIKNDGSLWAMGADAYGQLGDGFFRTNAPYGTNQPEMIVGSNVVAIAAGEWHSLFLKSDGSLSAMGANSTVFGNNGQLGDGTYNNTNRPEQIVASNVVAIAAGYVHSLFLKSDGSLWGMGDNAGELGAGISHNGTNRPTQIVASNVAAIAAGLQFSLFIKSDGSLWGMGVRYAGQLGDGMSGYIATSTIQPEQILAPYNQIAGQLMTNGAVQLSFVGIAAANYALDVSTSLFPPNWIPVSTNPTTSYGALVFTNTPDPTTNHFWRIRSVP